MTRPASTTKVPICPTPDCRGVVKICQTDDGKGYYLTCDSCWWMSQTVVGANEIGGLCEWRPLTEERNENEANQQGR